MWSIKSYVKGTSDFLMKIKELGKVSNVSILATANVASLYPSIPHEDGLDALSVKQKHGKTKILLKRIYLR